jgi:acyl-CoA oxidase
LELEQLQKWTAEEFRTAFATIDDSSSFGLHMVGEFSITLACLVKLKSCQAFEPVFMAQAGPELREHYGPLIRNRAILGCYLQTELAHGTNVAKLETTATYIPETKEFELHSPTITSSKWWIGALGKSATHGVVQAKLILPGGKDMGPHLFFVQLRSLSAFQRCSPLNCC